jgi:hypothetical protein
MYTTLIETLKRWMTYGGMVLEFHRYLTSDELKINNHLQAKVALASAKMPPVPSGQEVGLNSMAVWTEWRGDQISNLFHETKPDYTTRNPVAIK